MPMATILIVFLMVGGWALLSASQQWTARRQAYAVAASAARAAAQGDPTGLRTGALLDRGSAAERATAILTAAGAHGNVTIDGDRVIVTVDVAVGYTFPSPGFPASVAATATAVAAAGVDTEGA